jgi:anaerobic selenocysteine-containing dehydrogenase
MNLIEYAKKLAQQATDTVLKAAADTVIVIEHVDEETATFRYNVCLGCDFRDPDRDKCLACSCYLEEKSWSHTNRTIERPFGEVTHCPLGRWNDKEIANHYRHLDGKPLLQ